MEMTDREVKLNIMQAKDQKAQIAICAQLNNCSEDIIKDILRKQGVDLRTLLGTSYKKAPEVVPLPYIPEPVNIPAPIKDFTPDMESIFKALHNRVTELMEQKQAIVKELCEIKLQLSKIQHAMGEE